MSHDPSQVAQAPAPAGSAHDTASLHRGGNFLVLALGSVGVVFGDIGTSPLYALQTAMGQFKSGLAPHEVIGIVSLIVWALLIVVTAKYVLFLMMADNKGEGGILSLMALARIAIGKKHDARLSAGCGGFVAVFRRRDHHARHIGAFGAGGAQAGRRRTRAVRAAGDRRDSRSAVPRAKSRHGGRRGVFRTDHGRVLRCQRRFSASSTFPRHGASCAR